MDKAFEEIKEITREDVLLAMAGKLTIQHIADALNVILREQIRLARQDEREKVEFDCSPWVPPFRFEVTSVFDSKGHRVCDMRGWGFLTGKGCGLGLDGDTAAKIQDQMGETIANLLTAAAIRQRG